MSRRLSPAKLAEARERSTGRPQAVILTRDGGAIVVDAAAIAGLVSPPDGVGNSCDSLFGTASD